MGRETGQCSPLTDSREHMGPNTILVKVKSAKPIIYCNFCVAAWVDTRLYRVNGTTKRSLET